MHESDKNGIEKENRGKRMEIKGREGKDMEV